MINIKNFDSSFLKLDNLIVHEVDGFIEEKEGSKYLNFAFTDSNSEVLKNMQRFGVEVKTRLKQ